MLKARFAASPYLIAGFALIALRPAATHADQIVLRGGGQIRGKVVSNKDRPDRVVVLPEKGKTLLEFEKPKVLQVIPEPGPLDDYVTRRDKAPSTPDGQYELGIWCEEHRLKDLAEIHYQAAADYDKTFAPAHRKLGHVLHGDSWITRDELRVAQGLVRYKGKWMTEDEKERREEQAATAAERASWVRRIQALRQVLEVGAEERKREAEAKLMQIRDPLAVRPLMLVLSEDVEPIRTMLDQILGEIPDSEASRALVNRLLSEPDPDVRQVTMEQVGRRTESEVVPLLVKALRATNNAIVNRAAWGLANLGAISTVPQLIPALLTTQYRVVMTPNGGGSFGSVAPASGPSGILQAYNGNYSAYLTSVAVAPGAIAFGAATVPSYAGTGVSAGGASASRGPVPRLVPFTCHNVEVLAALNKLTGQDFGYDVAAWKRWAAMSYRSDPTPARRVPQP